MNLEPLKRPESIREHVYRLLKTELGVGRYRFGERIVEKALTDLLQVSRTPVRDALARLAAEGLLVETGYGYRVPVITVADLGNMTEVRLLLEPIAARQAALHPDKVGLSPMRQAIEDEKRADAAQALEDFAEARSRYRAAWLTRVANPYLLQSLAKSMASLQVLRHLTAGSAELRRNMIVSHAMLLDCLEAGDAEAAAETQRVRIQQFHDLLVAHFPAWESQLGQHLPPAR
jgi:DNA-binding GntR family transcriptional regulator